MRIHDQNPAGAGIEAPSTRAAQESRPAGGTAPQTGSRPSAGSGPDRVSLSNLAASLGPSAANKEAELDRLSELFDRGIYEPDPAAVADTLIEEGLMTPPEDTEGQGGRLG